MEAGALQAPAGLGRISISAPLLRLRSDEQLVAQFRAGNDDAFQVIFDRYRQRLFAYTRQMLGGSRQDAEDALQDVFLRAYGALRANDRPVSLRAWLYRVAHNRCVDELRRPTPASADVLDVSRPPLRDPLEESQRREDLRRLVADVGRLPEAQRSALLMREMDGLSYQELADALDVTIPAIKSLLVRARIGLVEAIEARDTACVEIRTDLLSSHDRGVRASGRARRHLRDCRRCRAYRSELRGVQRGLGALSPEGSSPLSVLAKLFGLGGAGGAAAGGGALVGGGGATVVGGGVATATACKVAALVCSAALVTGAAQRVEQAVKHAVGPATGASAHERHASAAAPAASLAPAHLVRLPAPAAAATARDAAAASGGAGAQARHHGDGAVDAQPSAAVAAAQEHGAITPDGEVYTMADPVFPAAGPAAPGTGGALAPGEDQPAAAVPAPAIAPAPGAAAATPTTASAPAGSPAAPAPGSPVPAAGPRPPAPGGATSPSVTSTAGTGGAPPAPGATTATATGSTATAAGAAGASAP